MQVKEEAVEEEMKNTKVSPGDSPPHWGTVPQGPVFHAPKIRKDILAERIASLVIKNPQNLNLIDQACLARMPQNIQVILTGLQQQESPQDEDLLNYLSLKVEAEEDEEVDCELEIKTCLKELESLTIKSQLDEISQNIKKAEEEIDSDKVPGLIQKFKETANRLINL